ncbi:hypothetical protein [Gilvibacter sediminis]|uniref:hypothetical protein n=1 Tax=Gilvibacter sediminis TaxID=379071 RepID=UPI002350F8B9|nr:hypothetical protein [Gilvibacter sediminis]MDC7998819.1 hypothetical protein [Gilvibacter sediminis]
MGKWFKGILSKIFAAVLLVSALSSCIDEAQNTPVPFEIENPSEGYAGMSRLFVADDVLYMSWVEQTDSLAVLKYASYDGNIWSTPEVIAEGTDWFVNWADFPQIAINQGNIFAHYLQKSAPDTYAYDIKYKIFNANSQSWSPPQKLHTDSTQSEHGFVDVIPYKDGFMASWLDGRTTVNRPDSLRQMTVRAGIINADGTLGQQWELDERVCDCCATSITETRKGPMVVYRDRSDNEVRDMYAVRLEDSVWSAPRVVFNDNWQIAGCPVNGPAISSNGMTAVGWFTMVDDKPQVKLGTMGTGSWFDEFLVLEDSRAIGRVDVAVDDQANAFALYMTDAGSTANLNLTHVASTGARMTHILSKMSPERASGFPQLVLFKDQVVISYTETDSIGSQINLVSYPFKAYSFEE